MQRSIIDGHIRRSEENTAARPAVCLWGCVVASHGVTTDDHPGLPMGIGYTPANPQLLGKCRLIGDVPGGSK